MAKSKSTSSDASTATVKKLRADLKRAEAKRATWKKRAKEAETAVADLQTQLREVDKQAKKARRKAHASAATDDPAPVDTPDAGTATPETTSGPDGSWTVAQLRAEARRRGLTGLSNKPKAELVKAIG